MEFDEKTIRCIAIGASVACNCQGCLEFNVARARATGAEEKEINEAIQIGKRVRAGAAAVMDRFIKEFQEASGLADESTGEKCECSNPINP